MSDVHIGYICRYSTMEILGPIIELAKMIYAPIGKCCIYHRGTDEYMRNLRNKWQDLERWKSDTEARMKAQLRSGKTPKQEVEGWLQDVERMNAEIQAIEREAGEGKCFSCAHVGKLAVTQIST